MKLDVIFDVGKLTEEVSKVDWYIEDVSDLRVVDTFVGKVGCIVSSGVVLMAVVKFSLIMEVISLNVMSFK